MIYSPPDFNSEEDVEEWVKTNRPEWLKAKESIDMAKEIREIEDRECLREIEILIKEKKLADQTKEVKNDLVDWGS